MESYSCYGFVRLLKQWVKIIGITSDILPITFDVSQDDHLSPLLFFLFINSAKRVLQNVRLLTLANDIILFYRIDSLNDCLVLKNELNKIVSWANNLGLQFNIAKFILRVLLTLDAPQLYLYIQ